ncbi:MAG: glycoside hydrolase family 92 protein, partial [Prevotellaceae bacterium]|nr:glycoside hydrolase family 92 protein [Prevotellaceae bacterium]
MKKKITLLLAAFAILTATAETEGLSKYVNPMIGASTDVEIAGAYHGLGKTFPGAATPYGMVQVSPQTITGGDNGPGYSSHMNTIEGFSLTQMSGIGWNGDLGNFTVMPTNGPLQLAMGREDGSQKGYRSLYNKKTETARAGYYAVDLTDYGIHTECTATTHCGFMRFTFPENKQSRIQIDLARRVGGTAETEEITIIDETTFEGWLHCTPDGGGWGDGLGHADYKIFFHATLSKPMKDWGLWSADIPDGQSRHLDDVISDKYQQRIADAKVERNARHAKGKHIGFFSEFDAVDGEQVVLKVGISYCDIEGARKNYKAEAEGVSFDEAHHLAR